MLKIHHIAGLILRLLAIVALLPYSIHTFAQQKQESLFFIQSMDKKLNACIGVAEHEDEFILELQNCTSKIYQTWRINKSKQLIAVESELCLDAGNLKAEEHVLSLMECNSSKQQKWKVVNKNNLKNEDGRCLVPVPRKNKKDALKIKMQKCANKLQQKWFVSDTEGYVAADKHGKAKGVAKLACPEGQFAHVAKKHKWGGYCVSCPEGYHRTMEEVDGPKACQIKQ